MWYDDLLLVMLLVVLALLAFTAILVATKIRKPDKEIKVINDVSPIEETTENFSSITKEAVYEKLYAEPEEYTEASSSIDMQPAIIQEDEPLIQMDVDNNPDTDLDIDDVLNETEDLDEGENEHIDTILPPVLNLGDTIREHTDFTQPEIHSSLEEIVEDNDQINNEIFQEPDLNIEKGSFFFDYKDELENEDSQEESEYFFNLKPQPFDDATDEETQEVQDETDNRLETESISTISDKGATHENHRQDEKNELGVTICPHCNAKVPATLYCIICGRPMKE